METEVKTMPSTETLAEWYLRESWAEFQGQIYGRAMAAAFRERLRKGEGVGQAFYNCTTPGDMARLAQSLHDPFHGGVSETHEAIEFLTRKGY